MVALRQPAGGQVRAGATAMVRTSPAPEMTSGVNPLRARLLDYTILGRKSKSRNSAGGPEVLDKKELEFMANIGEREQRKNGAGAATAVAEPPPAARPR